MELKSNKNVEGEVGNLTGIKIMTDKSLYLHPCGSSQASCQSYSIFQKIKKIQKQKIQKTKKNKKTKKIRKNKTKKTKK